jgi:uncharacterized glyoxalase superfamily protein PhnB
MLPDRWVKRAAASDGEQRRRFRPIRIFTPLHYRAVHAARGRPQQHVANPSHRKRPAVKANRSIPPNTVIPVLTYPDVRAAVGWLDSAFGAVEHVRIGRGHRAQMSIGAGAFVVAEAAAKRRPPASGEPVSISIMVRVEDVRAHCARARAAGAAIVDEPTDHAYGERQYSAVDPAGHHWTFTESIADVAPEEYGCITVEPWRHPRNAT